MALTLLPLSKRKHSVTGGLMTRGASIDSHDTEKRTAKLIWSTGAEYRKFDWNEGMINEELSMDPAHIRMGRLQSGRAPLLDSHDGKSAANQIGVVERSALQPGKGISDVRFATKGIDPIADNIFAKVQDGIVSNVSIGYRVYKYEKFVVPGQDIPTYRAIDWEPFEISMVSVPADADAFVQRSLGMKHDIEIFSRGMLPGDINNGVSVEKTEAELKAEQALAEAAKLAGEQARALAASSAAQVVPAPIPVPLASPSVQAIQAEETTRGLGIRALVKSLGLDEARSDEWVKAGHTMAKVNELALGEIAKRTDRHVEGHRIEMGEDSTDKFTRGATWALLADIVEVRDDLIKAKARGIQGFKDVDFDNVNEFRGFRLLDYARRSLEMAGQNVRGLSADQTISRALSLKTRNGPYGGTSDFPVLLENVMNKSLLGAYAVTPDLWSIFCKSMSMKDFRAANMYRTGSFGVLEDRLENGEYKNKAIPDGQKTSVTLGSKGNIFAITREALVNDDIAGIANTLAGAGRAAKLTIEKSFFDQLAQNSGAGPSFTDALGTMAFFHATRANIGSASAPAMLTIDADRVIMASQMDQSSNEYLDLVPAVALSGLQYGSTMRTLNANATDPASSKFQVANSVQGLFRDVKDTARVAGTKRYMFADPNSNPAFVVTFLDGNQSPRMETQYGWRSDGTEIKVALDAKVQPFDAKCAIYNAGA